MRIPTAALAAILVVSLAGCTPSNVAVYGTQSPAHAENIDRAHVEQLLAKAPGELTSEEIDYLQLYTARQNALAQDLAARNLGTLASIATIGFTAALASMVYLLATSGGD